MQRLIPLNHLGQVAKTVHRFLPGIGWAEEIAAVLDVNAKLGDGLRNARYPQCLRPHASAHSAGADVGGNTDQADSAWRKVSRGRQLHGVKASFGRQASGSALTPSVNIGRIRLNRSFGLASLGISDTN